MSKPVDAYLRTGETAAAAVVGSLKAGNGDEDDARSVEQQQQQQQQRPVFVPCLRTGASPSLTVCPSPPPSHPPPSPSPSPPPPPPAMHQSPPSQLPPRATTTTTTTMVPTRNEQSVNKLVGGEGHPVDLRVEKCKTAHGECAHGEQQADAVTGDADEGASPNDVEERREGVVAASVRVGDWVLPVRRGGAGCGFDNQRQRPGGKMGGGWLRVEVVSIG